MRLYWLLQIVSKLCLYCSPYQHVKVISWQPILIVPWIFPVPPLYSTNTTQLYHCNQVLIFCSTVAWFLFINTVRDVLQRCRCGVQFLKLAPVLTLQSIFKLHGGSTELTYSLLPRPPVNQVASQPSSYSLKVFPYSDLQFICLFVTVSLHKREYKSKEKIPLKSVWVKMRGTSSCEYESLGPLLKTFLYVQLCRMKWLIEK